MKSLRSALFLSVLLISLWLPGGKHVAAQEELSLPGQIAYVENGNRLMLVRGNLDKPILLVQTREASVVGNPHFSRDGRYLAYCIQNPTVEDYPSLYYLDTRNLEKVTVTREGSCSYNWSPDGKTLIFSTPPFLEREATMPEGIWSYAVESRELDRMIPTDAPVVDPRWSSDGKTISYFDFCFECLGQFHTYDLSTRETKEWSEAGTERIVGPDVSWSPDGRSLAFDREIWAYAPSGRTYGLQVASSDGMQWSEFHSLPGRAAYFPIWSPDGKRIAFASFESFTIGNFINRRGELMTVAPDGSDVRRQYSSIFEVFPQAWSPDSRYLLLVEPIAVAQNGFHEHQLVLIEAQMGEVLWTVPSFKFIQADWAPVPTAVAATATPPVQMAGKKGILFVSSDYALAFLDPVTGHVQKLTTPFSGQEISVSPDGQTVLFGDQILSFKSQADGTVMPSIVASLHPRQFFNLRWSPDGQKYGFVDQDSSAWVVDKLGNREQLAYGQSPPQWSYDGHWMAYCDKDGRLWIAQSGKPADWIIQRDRCEVSWSPTQAILAYITYPPRSFENPADGTAFLYDPINGRTREIAGSVSSLTWSPDGKLVGISRVTSVGANNYAYTVSAVNPETGVELLIDEFHAEMPENSTWLEQTNGYLLGRYRFQADLLTKEPAAEWLFDATRDGSRLLVGSGGFDDMEIGCRDTASGSYYPILRVTQNDTPGAAMPGLYGKLSPGGDWILISDYVEQQMVNWLAHCGEGEPVQLLGHDWLYDPYFSPDGAWLLMEQTNSFEEEVPRIRVHELEKSALTEVQAGLNTHSAWFHMPEAPAVPATELVQGTEPAISSTPTRVSGPINLQNDVPNPGGRSSLLPLLLWAGALIAVVVLTYFFWKQPFGKQAQAVVEAVAVEAEPIPEAAPAQAVSPKEIHTYFREGVELVRAGKAEEGILALKKVVAATPGNEDAWFWLAIACVRGKDSRAAERCFLQAKRHGHPEADKALEWLRKQTR